MGGLGRGRIGGVARPHLLFTLIPKVLLPLTMHLAPGGALLLLLLEAPAERKRVEIN